MEDSNKKVQGVERIEKNRTHFIQEYSPKDQVLTYFNVFNEKQLKDKIIDNDWEITKRILINRVNTNDKRMGVQVYPENVTKVINFKMSEYKKEIEIKKVLAILSDSIKTGKFGALLFTDKSEFIYLSEVIEFLEKSDIFNIKRTINANNLLSEQYMKNPNHAVESYEITFKSMRERIYIENENEKWAT